MRVRLRIRRVGGEAVETVALVNSGFEADSPQLLIPLGLAERLNLQRLLVERSYSETYSTVSGTVTLYVIPGAIEVQVVEDDVETEPVRADAVVSPVEREVLISDYLAGLLGIMVDDFRLGLWRLRVRPNVVRKSYEPQYW